MREEAHHGHWRRTYGISPEQYDTLLFKQGGCCGCCQKPASEFKTRLAIDHNHKTNEVRGLLCYVCNHRVVGRHTDASLLRQAATYLEQAHTGWYVPEKKKRKKRGHTRSPRSTRRPEA